MDSFGPVTPAQKGARITEILDEAAALLSVGGETAMLISSFVHKRHQPAVETLIKKTPTPRTTKTPSAKITDSVPVVEHRATDQDTAIENAFVDGTLPEEEDRRAAVSPFVVSSDPNDRH
jgi:hypothetical protein